MQTRNSQRSTRSKKSNMTQPKQIDVKSQEVVATEKPIKSQKSVRFDKSVKSEKSDRSKSSKKSYNIVSQSQDVVSKSWSSKSEQSQKKLSQCKEKSVNSASSASKPKSENNFVRALKLSPLEVFKLNVILQGSKFIFDCEKDVEKRMNSANFKNDLERYLHKKHKKSGKMNLALKPKQKHPKANSDEEFLDAYSDDDDNYDNNSALESLEEEEKTGSRLKYKRQRKQKEYADYEVEHITGKRKRTKIYNEQEVEIEEKPVELMDPELRRVQKNKDWLKSIKNLRDRGIIEQILKLLYYLKIMVDKMEGFKDLSEIFDDYSGKIHKFEFNSTQEFTNSLSITLKSIFKIKSKADPSLQDHWESLMRYFEIWSGVIPDICFDEIRRKSMNPEEELEENKPKRIQKSEVQKEKIMEKKLKNLEEKFDYMIKRQTIEADYEYDSDNDENYKPNLNKGKKNTIGVRFKSDIKNKIFGLRKEDIKKVIDLIENHFHISWVNKELRTFNLDMNALSDKQLMKLGKYVDDIVDRYNTPAKVSSKKPKDSLSKPKVGLIISAKHNIVKRPIISPMMQQKILEQWRNKELSDSDSSISSDSSSVQLENHDAAIQRLKQRTENADKQGEDELISLQINKKETPIKLGGIDRFMKPKIRDEFKVACNEENSTSVSLSGSKPNIPSLIQPRAK